MKRLNGFFLVLLAMLLLVGGSEKTGAVQTTVPYTGNIPEASAAPGPAPIKKIIASLDTGFYSLNVGDYYVFRAKFTGTPGDWTTLDGESLRSEVLSFDGVSALIRITALKPGETRAGVKNAEGEASFPVSVKGSGVSLDTNAAVALETGTSYGFVVSSVSGEKPDVTAEGMELREFSREGLAAGSFYCEATALKAGSFRVKASLNGDTVSFPVNVSVSAAEQKAQGYDSATDMMILTDLADQRVMVFQGEKGSWEMLHAFPCSSGAPGWDTPTGVYRIQGRGDWFFNRRLNEGAQWYLIFQGNYLFHSYPMDRSGKVLDYRLGQPLSHGCVRLRTEDAKWLYDTIPTGTRAVIY